MTGAQRTLAAVVCRLLGCRAFELRTGSMAPNYPAGSLVWVRRAPARLRPGMILLYRKPGGVPVLHRLVRVQEATGGLILKGDANLLPDPAPVPRSWVQGQLVWGLPPRQ